MGTMSTAHPAFGVTSTGRGSVAYGTFPRWLLLTAANGIASSAIPSVAAAMSTVSARIIPPLFIARSNE
jgi:hypothetical protein